LDSFNISTISEIYCSDDEFLSKQIANVDIIKNHVIVRDNLTNICASIVPTTINQNEIIDIIDWCYTCNIFPLIGDLENAGNSVDKYKLLKLPDSKLREIKQHILNKYGEYQIPICPATLFGIHINHKGEVIVDRRSGLSCHWFWLVEPNTKEIDYFYDYSCNELSQVILEYRSEKRDEVSMELLITSPLIFGGCGGDIRELLTFYLDNM
jgi:hypothetical protein